MTAWVIFSPSRVSASALSLPRIMAEISGGLNRLGLPPTSTSTRSVAVSGADDFIGDAFDFFLHLVKLPPHEPLDRIDRIAGVSDGLPFGRLADEAVTGFGECHHGRRRAFAFGVFEARRARRRQ